MALRTSISFSDGPGIGVSAISPVNLIPIAAIFRTSARAASGVLFSLTCPDGMMRGPLMSALVDVIPERDVSFRRTASGQDGRVSGFEKRLHLRPSHWARY